MLADVEKIGGCSELPTGKRDLDVTETPVSIHAAPAQYPRILKETKNPRKVSQPNLEGNMKIPCPSLLYNWNKYESV